MARPRPWTVPPHDPVVRCEANLRLADAALPPTAMRRRMSAFRYADGRLLLVNAIPLREEEMAALLAWGEPAFVLVPNRFHRLDLRAWKDRFPALRFHAPAEAARAVSEVVPLDGDLEALPPDPDLSIHPLPGWRLGDPVVEVRSGPRRSLLFGDTLMNNRPAPGAHGLVLRILGAVGGPKVTPVGRLLGVRDAAALAGALRRLA
ncbi:MAG TPA: hypothetical protein PLL32_04865, partial [Anaeromyxobacteraceae bacterium]|nr:hypothetical protein [Anaeromyxobacteraceae bacterium]